ncbi:MAG: hypothetical protein KAR00_00640 [Candidatus Pacebacteria bacterium]|nr:hypothetical protein [Candidatus Paceibacterota bacterium]
MKGDCDGHLIIDLCGRKENVFSRQAAEEIVAQAFFDAKITGHDFHRLIKEIEKTPYLKGSRRLHLLDIVMDLSRLKPQLRSVQKLVVQEEMVIA